jgi:septation ring formation regulator EzrA
MAHTKKHAMRQKIAKNQLKVRQNRPPTRKKTPFSKTEYLWPDGRYRNQRPPLQSKGLTSNNKVEKKVNKVEKKPVKVEKKVNKVEKKPVKVEKKVDKVEKKVNKVEKKPVKVEKKVNKVEKKDPLKDYRRGPGTKLGKDTRITKKLKKSGFTEDRLARLRKKHAEFKAKRRKKKTKLKIGG